MQGQDYKVEFKTRLSDELQDVQLISLVSEHSLLTK